MPSRWMSFLFPAPPAARPRPPARPAGFTVDLDQRSVEVALRRNARARRYTLRVRPRGDGAVVTIPRRGTIAEAKAFVNRHLAWLEEKLGAPAAATDRPPETVRLRGIDHRVVLTGAARGVVRITVEDGAPALHVPGEPGHAHRRVTEFLKRQARQDLVDAVARHAASLGVRPTAVRLKDTTSRWGSASTRGTLSFSWRLVMAPPFVLDYLAAHEVAHLKEMNHSDRFWAHCYRLAPRTDEAKAWLKAHGRDLHRVL